MKLAVFLPNWVGDVVMATPALRALREHFNDATIYGVMKPYVADVLAGTDLIDETIFDERRGWSRGVFPLASRLRRESIDLAILFTNSFRTAFVSWQGKCKQRIGYHRDGRGLLLTDTLKPIVDTHGKFHPSPIIDAYNLLAEKAGTPKPSHRMELGTKPEDEQQADQVWQKFEMSIHRPVIALNPGAAFGSAKQWPAHHFARLARKLVDQIDAQVLVLCGPKERDLAQIIVQQTDRNDVHSLAQEKLTLGLTKACIRRSDLLITTDSGPRHFAAAFNRPVVSLFGPTHIEWTDTFYAKEVHLQHRLPCGPCQQRVCPIKGTDHHRCMQDLMPEEVFSASMKLLNGTTTLKLIQPPTQHRRAS
ncbi:MAG: lipopolysaccharide heptosyltransferase II [Gemmatales bacterium]